MTEHCCPCPTELPVPPGGNLDDQDVFHVTGVTGSVEVSGGQVSVVLNEDELFHAFKASCARAEIKFADFKAEINADANVAATEVYQPARDLNEVWSSLPNAQRILRIRLCVRWRWIRIYINWKI